MSLSPFADEDINVQCHLGKNDKPGLTDSKCMLSTIMPLGRTIKEAMQSDLTEA